MYGELVSPGEITPAPTSDIPELSEDQHVTRGRFVTNMLVKLDLATGERPDQIQAEPPDYEQIEGYFVRANELLTLHEELIQGPHKEYIAASLRDLLKSFHRGERGEEYMAATGLTGEIYVQRADDLYQALVTGHEIQLAEIEKRTNGSFFDRLEPVLVEVGISERNITILKRRLSGEEGLLPYSQFMHEFNVDATRGTQIIRSIMNQLIGNFGVDHSLVQEAAETLYPVRKLQSLPYKTDPSEKTNTPPLLLDRVKKNLAADEEVALAKLIESGVYAKRLLEKMTKTDYNADEQMTKDLRTIVHEGSRAQEVFAERNSGLVHAALLRRSSVLKNWGVNDPSELFSAVVEKGLIKAIQKFDFTAGYKFSTYADSWLNKAVDEALIAYLPFPIGHNDFSRAIKVSAYIERRKTETERHPSINDIAKEFNLTINKAKRLQDYIAISENYRHNANQEVQRTVHGGDALNLFYAAPSSAEERERAVFESKLLHEALDVLDEVGLTIIVRLYFEEEKNLKMIAAELGLGLRQAQTIRHESLHAMQRYIKKASASSTK